MKNHGISGTCAFAGVATFVLGVFAPLAALDGAQQIPADSVLSLPELTVEIGRLRTGSVQIAEVPFPVQFLGGSNVRGTTGSSVENALRGSSG